ncbi:hypothetical protein CLF_101005 [Clonorchis sinensis]|uniref:Uncharacterized protein n=1 Tax=Clonorchis sinensis TaxID=79923 RepID=G7Y4Q9_CLOSI|nr:hypothetical protein CLF_101005 [Clonorchis sinensis]
MLCSCGNSRKDSPVKCTTNLAGYMGEHLSQTFYNRMVIRDIQCGSRALSPMCIGIGQPTPIDLSDCYGVTDCDPRTVLCVAVHYFQRNYRVIPASKEIHCTLQQRDGIVDSESCDQQGTSSPPSVGATDQQGVGISTKSSGKKLALVTFLVYYPVGFMKSANDLLILPEQNKHAHLPPHEHEFVAYPKMFTLPVEEVGSRIVWGMMNSHKLRLNALTLSGDFLSACLGNHPSLRVRTREEDGSASSLECPVSNQFTITSKGLYTRLCVIHRLQREGVNSTRLRTCTHPTDRLWYSKVLTVRTNRPADGSSSLLEPTELSEASKQSEAKTEASLLDWIGFKLKKCILNGVDVSPADEHVVRETPVKCIHVVFVRRESADCGEAICENLKTATFPPAKLRRTRVRGTVQSGIKLKRRFSDLDLSTHTSDPVKRDNQKIPSLESLDPLGLKSEAKSEWSMLYSDSLPWKRSYSPPPCHNGPLSPTSLLHASIAIRVKQGAYLCRQSAALKDGQSTACQLTADQTDQSDAGCDVTYQTRNRVPPKRYDLAEQDLEIALQRSLNDKLTGDRRFSRRKSQDKVKLNITSSERDALDMKCTDSVHNTSRTKTMVHSMGKLPQRIMRKLDRRAGKITSSGRHATGSTKTATRKPCSPEPTLKQEHITGELRSQTDMISRKVARRRVKMKRLGRRVDKKYNVTVDQTNELQHINRTGHPQGSEQAFTDSYPNLPKLTVLKGGLTVKLRCPTEESSVNRTCKELHDCSSEELNLARVNLPSSPTPELPTFRIEDSAQVFNDFPYPLNLSVTEQDHLYQLSTDVNSSNQSGGARQTPGPCTNTLPFVNQSLPLSCSGPMIQSSSLLPWSVSTSLSQEIPNGQIGSSTPLTMWTKLQHPLPPPEIRPFQPFRPEFTGGYTQDGIATTTTNQMHCSSLSVPSNPIEPFNLCDAYGSGNLCSLTAVPPVPNATLVCNPSQTTNPEICMPSQAGHSGPSEDERLLPQYTQIVQSNNLACDNITFNIVTRMNLQSDPLLWSSIPPALGAFSNQPADAIPCSRPPQSVTQIQPVTSTTYWNPMCRTLSADVCQPVATVLHTPSLVQTNLPPMFLPSAPAHEITTDTCKSFFYVQPTVNSHQPNPFVTQFQPVGLLPFCETSTPLAVLPVPCPLQFIT